MERGSEKREKKRESERESEIGTGRKSESKLNICILVHR